MDTASPLPRTSPSFSIGPSMREEIRRALMGRQRPGPIGHVRWQMLRHGTTPYIWGYELAALCDATGGSFVATILKGAQAEHESWR